MLGSTHVRSQWDLKCMAIQNTFIFKVRMSYAKNLDVNYCYLSPSFIAVPAPHSLTITSKPVSPIRPIGGSVTLTCSVELSNFVDVPVTVDVQLSGPAGRPLTNTTIYMSGFSYTATTTISSFTREQSGTYTCIAIISYITISISY